MTLPLSLKQKQSKTQQPKQLRQQQKGLQRAGWLWMQQMLALRRRQRQGQTLTTLALWTLTRDQIMPSSGRNTLS